MSINQDSLLVDFQTEQFIITYTNNQLQEIYVDTVLVTADGTIPRRNLPSGTYTMYINSPSFLDFEMKDIVVKGNTITFLDLQFESKGVRKEKTIRNYQKPIVTVCG